MAKILLGPTVIGIRGTVAGITFSANRGGPYARGWYKPPTPTSSGQRAAQTKLGYWATAWRSLTAPQQATWDAYAALPAQQLTDSLGQPYYASGFNWYVTTQINLQMIGAAAIPTAPVLARLAAPTVTTFSWSISQVNRPLWQMGAASPGLATNHAMWLAIVNSKGQLITPADYYFMRVQIPDASRFTSAGPMRATKFGTALINQRAFGSIYTISAEGQASPETFTAVNATA